MTHYPLLFVRRELVGARRWQTNVPALRNWEEGVRKVKAGQVDAD